MTATTAPLTVTTTPSTSRTSRTVVFDGRGAKSLKAIAFVTLTGDDARRTFTSTTTDGRIYTNRLDHFTLYEDGTVWGWAANINKRTGEPFKNGYGLTVGNDVSRYGAAVTAVLAEAIATARAALAADTDPSTADLVAAEATEQAADHADDLELYSGGPDLSPLATGDYDFDARIGL